MSYLLDTDICVDIIRNRSTQLLQKLQQQPLGTVGVSTITVAELSTGVAKSNRPKQNADALALFLLPLEVYPFDELAAQVYGMIRANLERQGTPTGSMDTLIAAHALALDLTIVTRNSRHFGRAAGLEIEDWLDPPGQYEQ